MTKDWRPSFILAFAIFTAVVTALHADRLVTNGQGSFTIALVIMAIVMVVVHRVSGRSGGGDR